MAQKKSKMPAKAVAKTKKTAKGDIVDIVDIEPTPEIVTSELDPEILEALSAKKAKKVKPAADVDYIPELERDTNDFDLDFDK
jgi:hypothetical protein